MRTFFRGRSSDDRGFSLLELLIATAIVLLLAGAVAVSLSMHASVARAQPEAADVQQRARAAADVLAVDIGSAGAWSDDAGTSLNLACCLPVVSPRRIGLRLPDAPGAALDDRISIVRAAQGAIPASLGQPLVAGVLMLESGGACPAAATSCGLAEEDTVLVFDPEGRHDFFLVGPPSAGGAPVVPRQAGAPHLFPAGSFAVKVETRTYYYDADTRQLRQHDGHLSDVPVIDDVVGVRFEYWGTTGAPLRSRLQNGVATCWFDADGLPRSGAGAAAPDAPLELLPLATFQDGPWCGAGDNRFDADLLRIRRVRVTVRVGAASGAVRGRGAQFQRAGTATDALKLVPDFEVSIDVAPRNLNTDR